MADLTIHNPDRYMVDLRQILSQGRKRIGFLFGAGVPSALIVDNEGILSEEGQPLIPDVGGLTDRVVDDLGATDRKIVEILKKELGDKPNIEEILTRVRRLSQAIGTARVHDLNGSEYEALAEQICEKIGHIVGPKLPDEPNPYTQLVSWIGGAHRAHPIEVFTPNYDLLLEEAFERAQEPYFDGFTGAHLPFFDPVSIADDHLPARWSRLWKLHGSLGWDERDGTIIRTGSRSMTKLIYPDHLKYDQISRQPYSALFERLREFLTTPDSLLICSGFSFGDPHICAVLDEALGANKHTAILAFQYKTLNEEPLAVKFALKRRNLSVYGRDGAIIFGVPGKWKPGQPPSDEWEGIRRTFWRHESSEQPSEFLLGDFAKLAPFCALAEASNMVPATSSALETENEEKTTSANEALSEDDVEEKI